MGRYVTTPDGKTMYQSTYSGEQLDTSLGRIINGELDTAVDGAAASATAAASSAQVAAGSASVASDSEEAAVAAAGVATTKATEASDSAASALASKDSATVSKDSAAASAVIATNKATLAESAAATATAEANRAKTEADRAGAIDTYPKAYINRHFSRALKGNATGESLNVPGVQADSLLSKLVLSGNTVQAGTPSPDAPVPLQSVSGPIAAKVSKHHFASAYTIQAAIRAGTIQSMVRVGDFFTIGRGGTNWLFQVAAFDYDVPVKAQYTHSMRLLMYPCFANMAFDAREAIYYAATELAAGTYWFIDTRGTTKYCSFTLATAIPAGGQIVATAIAAAEPHALTTLAVYPSQTATTATVTRIAVTTTTEQPTAGAQLTAINDVNRARWGSCDWLQSTVRQWLNSDKATGWWVPKNNYDRPRAAPVDGFLCGIDADLLACIGKVRLRTRLNESDNGGTHGYADSDELVFFPSRYEVGLGVGARPIYETPVEADGTAKTTAMPLFTSNADRIKYLSGVANYWLMRSPYPDTSNAHSTYLVSLTGALDSNGAANGGCAVPACVIY